VNGHALECATKPAAVWALDTKWIENKAKKVVPKSDLEEYDKKRNDYTFKKLFMPYRLDPPQKPKGFISTVNPLVLNKRLSIQQGLFLAVGDVCQSFACTLGSYKDGKGHLVKIGIQREVGREILKLLYSMGISRASLYPGLDGFAWSLRTKAHALREIV